MHLPERPAAAPRRPFSWEDVDRLLNPANRAHMVLEEQLRELLDKLDLTCSMKSSGSRSKRAKLLKKEIALLRTKLSQQHSPPPPAESGTGGLEEDGARPGPQAGEEVLPRLETLLQPRKRSRSTCGDSEVEEGSPGKRLDTGKRTGARRPAFPRGVSGRSVGGGACRLWRGARPPRFLWAPVRRPGFSRPGARCRSEVAPPGAGLARGSRCPFSGASGPRGAWPCRAPWGAGGPPCSGVARPGLSAASRARGGRWGVCSRPRSPAGTTRERVCP